MSLWKGLVAVNKYVSLNDNKAFHAPWKSPVIYHDDGGARQGPWKCEIFTSPNHCSFCLFGILPGLAWLVRQLIKWAFHLLSKWFAGSSQWWLFYIVYCTHYRCYLSVIWWRCKCLTLIAWLGVPCVRWRCAAVGGGGGGGSVRHSRALTQSPAG